MATNNRDLEYLDEMSDYGVADGYSDVRGWDVLDADNRKIGEVEGLLASRAAKRVVYLDVEVDEDLITAGRADIDTSANPETHEFENADGDDHIIIPIGMVNFNEHANNVHASQIKHATFAKANRLGKRAEFDRAYEVEVYQLYAPEGTAIAVEDGTFYDQPHFRNPMAK